MFCVGVPLVAEGLQERPACHRRCQVTLLVHRIRCREVFQAGTVFWDSVRVKVNFCIWVRNSQLAGVGRRSVGVGCSGGEDAEVSPPTTDHGVTWHHPDALETEGGMAEGLN